MFRRQEIYSFKWWRLEQVASWCVYVSMWMWGCECVCMWVHVSLCVYVRLPVCLSLGHKRRQKQAKRRRGKEATRQAKWSKRGVDLFPSLTRVLELSRIDSNQQSVPLYNRRLLKGTVARKRILSSRQDVGHIIRRSVTFTLEQTHSVSVAFNIKQHIYPLSPSLLYSSDRIFGWTKAKFYHTTYNFHQVKDSLEKILSANRITRVTLYILL